MTALQTKLNSPLGTLYLVASENGLRGISWEKQDTTMLNSVTEKSRAAKVLVKAALELEEYFAGKRKTFSVALELEGSEFQNRVWKQLTKIPYGETQSYKQIADPIKSGKAYRAVGTANGKNPLPIIVPCHRVIAADGSLGGYSGGLEIKTKLLQIEKKTSVRK